MEFTITVYLLVMLLFTEPILGLQCWYCLGDQCDFDPSDNDNAKVIPCGQGQVCQKSYFEMYNEDEKRTYISTVRSCSSLCKQRNDFRNCSYQVKSSLGCVRKDCCHNNDLCNDSDIRHSAVTSWILPSVIYIVVR